MSNKDILIITGPQGSRKSLLARVLEQHAGASVLVLDPFGPTEVDMREVLRHDGLTVLVTNESVESMVARTKGPDLERLNWIIGSATMFRLAVV